MFKTLEVCDKYLYMYGKIPATKITIYTKALMKKSCHLLARRYHQIQKIDCIRRVYIIPYYQTLIFCS